MHICFVTNEYPGKNIKQGGIGSFVKVLAEYLVKKNITISVIGIYNVKKQSKEILNKVEIYRLPKSNWKFAKFFQHKNRLLSQLKKIDKKTKIDIVEGSELSFAFFPEKTSYKKVIRLHGGHHFFSIELGKKPDFWKAFQEKKSFYKADSCIGVSNYVACKTQEYLNFQFPFSTIYNFVDVDKFSSQELNLPETNTILFVGTVCEKKGVRQLVNSMEIVLKKIPDAKLKIVGKDWFFSNGNSYIEMLKEEIPKKLKKHIDFVGSVSANKIIEYYKKAELCVLPSHMESFGLVVLEAIFMEKPVILSNITPFKEILSDKNSGVFIDPYKPESIANAIINLLVNKIDAKVMAKKAKKNILKRFNADKITDENITFYKNILA